MVRKLRVGHLALQPPPGCLGWEERTRTGAHPKESVNAILEADANAEWGWLSVELFSTSA